MWEILEHRTVWKWIGFPPFIWILLPSTSLEIFHQGPHVIWMKSYGMYVKGIHDKDLIFHLETSEKTLLLQGCGLEITAVVKMCSVAQLCPPFCDPRDCSSPSSSVHGIFQARILEWVAIYSSRGSSQTRDWTRLLLLPALAGRFFTTEPLRKPSLSQSQRKYSANTMCSLNVS